MKIKFNPLLISLTILATVPALNCSNDVDYQILIFGITEEQLIDADSISFSFLISPDDWKEKGYTAHFLLDQDHPQIKQGEATVAYGGLTEGAHAIFAMICDRNGISLKTPGSIAIRNFFSRRKTQALIQQDEPLLVLHEPQGELFKGKEGKRILFDFRVLNAELGMGYWVHYNLNGEDFYLDSEEHVWLKNAQRIGGHELAVSLETEAGNPVVDNPFNQITKNFGVSEK